MGVAIVEKQKLLLFAMIVEKWRVGSLKKKKKKAYTDTQMRVTRAAVEGRVQHLTFKCPGRNEFPSSYGELPQPLFSGLPSGLKTHKDICSFRPITRRKDADLLADFSNSM